MFKGGFMKRAIFVVCIMISLAIASWGCQGKVIKEAASGLEKGVTGKGQLESPDPDVDFDADEE